LKNRFIFVFIWLLLLQVSAQQDSLVNTGWQIKPVFSRGFIMLHRISIGHLVKGYPNTYEINVSRPSPGNCQWQHENNRPDIGLTLQFLDFANPQQLGYAFTAAPYVEIPLNEQQRASRVVMRVCWGLTYVTKHFDIYQNHKNTAIGSHLNAFVQFRWFWQWQITDRLRFEPGFSFSHASNGKSKNPNLGLNIMSLSAGVNYRIGSNYKPANVIRDSSCRVKSKYELTLGTAIGFNQRAINTPMLRTYVFAASIQRNLRNTHKFSAGVDVYYDDNYQIDFREWEGYTATGLSRYRMSARLGYAYNIGRISLPIEVGYYVFQKVNPDANLVSRLGVRYYDKSGLILSFGLRTHFAVAYAFEYGIGYCIAMKK